MDQVLESRPASCQIGSKLPVLTPNQPQDFGPYSTRFWAQN